jgi:hypothetical protein
MAFADTRDAQFNFDASGNKNNWIANNINSNASSEPSYDIMTDVPTLTDEYTANYCTLNPLDKYPSAEILEGNLRIGANSNTWIHQARSTFFVSSGKWYWEVTCSPGTGTFWKAGIRDAAAALTSNTTSSTGYEYYAYNGNKQATGVNSSYGSSLAANDVLAFALDMDAGTITAYKNGSSLGVMFSGLSGSYSPTVSMYNGSISFNFGQRPFAYTPPTGFLPLNTYNLPDSTIVNGSEHMKTVEWTGTTAAQSIDFGMQPDLIWAKGVNSAAGHRISDSVRGGNGTHLYNISTSSTAVENTDTVIDAITSTGIDLGTLNHPNNNGTVYVGWGWKANGSGVSNTVGDTNATVSANTTSGFSIVSFNAGAAGNHTVGHGLGVTPEMIIMKDRNSSGYGNWTVFHSAVCTSTSNYLLLNGTGALGSVANSWGSALPTSTVFGFGSNVNVAANDNIIAYCFAPVEGFSAFGSYTGNGSTDGPFVYTGFKPSWLMVKSTTYSGTNWLIFDNARNLYNVVELELNANNNNQEYNNGRDVDFLNNGFKVRSGANNNFNTSGGNYIYVAFAENPFKNSLAR